jgi:hypothetical protein
MDFAMLFLRVQMYVKRFKIQRRVNLNNLTVQLPFIFKNKAKKLVALTSGKF